MKQRVRKKISSQIISKYSLYFENMLSPVLKITEVFNPSEFRTQELEIRESVEKQFQNVDGVEFGEILVETFKKADLLTLAKSSNKKIKNEVNEKKKKDNRFSKLNHLVNEVEKIYPNVSIAVFFRNNPMESFVKALEPYDLIKDFEKQKGERAARIVIRIYREVAEMLYENYVRGVCELLGILEGEKIIKSHQSFGVLVNQLPNRLKKFGYESLIDEDAAWLRNATCHGHWKFIPKTGTIALWDKNKPEKEFGVDELFNKAMAMYYMVIENYLPLIFIYLKGKIANEWLDVMKYLQKNIIQIIENEAAETKYLEDSIKEIFAFANKIEFKRSKE